MSKKVRKAAVKEYAIVRGRYAGEFALGGLGGVAVEGPYEIVEDHLPDHRAARARALELEAEENPTADRAGGVHVFVTGRPADYRPAPLRHSEYRIRAWYAYKGDEAVEVNLADVRRRASAVKDFKDYLRRVRKHDGIFRLVRAELVRDDFYKGKPAGGETILHSRDVPA